MKRLVMCLCIAMPVAVCIAFQQYEWPPQSVAYTTGFMQVVDRNGNTIDCPPEGKGTDIDPYLNRLKNRDLAPATTPAVKTLTQIFSIQAPNMMAMLNSPKKDRPEWTEAARTEARANENQFVSVEGFLVGQEQMGPEACNCGSPSSVDRHIWLGPFPKNNIPNTFPNLQALYAATTDKSKFSVRHHSMVVETSPRMNAGHPNWTAANLNKLVRDGTKVRITGWMMFDQEHKGNLFTDTNFDKKQPSGRTRRTLWEVHPIHKIEFLKEGVWRNLDALDP